MNPRPTNVVIADDHPVVMKGLMQILQGEPDFRVLAGCLNGRDCLEAIRRFRPDLALLDMGMPGLTGLEVLAAVVAEKLGTRVVFLAASFADHEIVAAASGGTWGLMAKDEAPERLLDCLRDVAGGRKWLRTELVIAAMERERALQAKRDALAGVLTQREREVGLLVADGLSNEEVARRLNVSPGTVKLHLHSIYQKLGVKNRTALAAWANSCRELIAPTQASRAR
jgi:two-component system nitrate/nitrite response regulator NarL